MPPAPTGRLDAEQKRLLALTGSRKRLEGLKPKMPALHQQLAGCCNVRKAWYCLAHLISPISKYRIYFQLGFMSSVILATTSDRR